jgi:ornithine cyclodeaminase
MRSVTSEEVKAALDFPSLVEALREGFRRDVAAPVRHHHTIPRTDEPDATLLLMPAWQSGRHVGIKIVTVTPGNAARSLPAVMGIYLLNDWQTGAPLALIDGPMLTLRRTAAASALGASYLAREDAGRLLMVGTGALAPHLIEAHAAVRPIRRVQVWGRTPAKAGAVADAVRRDGLEVEVAEDLEAAARGADVISCATLSREPLIRGDWLQPGVHVDLVGAFTPEMREADDEAIRRARVFVDTRAGATKEGGDIVQPLKSGALKETDIAADLFALTRGERPGRGGAAEITLFKSVGTALEDLAAAQLVVERA